MLLTNALPTGNGLTGKGTGKEAAGELQSCPVEVKSSVYKMTVAVNAQVSVVKSGPMMERGTPVLKPLQTLLINVHQNLSSFPNIYHILLR